MTQRIKQRGHTFQGYASATWDGKLRSDRRSFESYRQAKRWVIRREAELRRGMLNSTKDITQLHQLVTKAEEKFWMNGRNHATIAGHLKSIRKFFGDSCRIEDITAAMVEDYDKHLREEKGNSLSTVNRKLTTLGKMLAWAERMEWLDKKPYIQKNTENPGRLRYPSLEEEAAIVEQLLAANEFACADLVEFLADTGLRVGEALKLVKKDIVDLDTAKGIRVHSHKSHRERVVPLTKRARAIVESRHPLSQDIFQDVDHVHFNSAWNKAKVKLGIDDATLVPHTLRHAAASRLIQGGIPLASIREILGHKNLQTTLIYAHLAPTHQLDMLPVLEALRN